MDLEGGAFGKTIQMRCLGERGEFAGSFEGGKER